VEVWVRAATLLFLRFSVGWLMVVWGADKLVNPAHGVAVASGFYFGLFGQPALMTAYGIAQIALGALVVAGALRRYTYPVLAGITGLTLVGVWRSVVDPWGWYLGRTNALFYPSLIIFASVLVLMAFRDADRYAMGRR
jgi:uncharacterized membrane protein YphA (DoxX/SURF4 family)